MFLRFKIHKINTERNQQTIIQTIVKVKLSTIK